MLQKLDTEHLNRLAVAEALSKLDPTDFDMRDASRCICAHALRLFGEDRWTYYTWQDQLEAGARLLGLTSTEAKLLFAPKSRYTPSDRTTHPLDAARVVRYLAATDTVDWGIAGKQ
jgi:hypothetical protein